MAASTWAQVLAGALGGMFQGIGQQQEAAKADAFRRAALQRQADQDAAAESDRQFTRGLATLKARSEYGLVDPSEAEADAARAGEVARTAPQLGDPMMAGMSVAQGLARQRQMGTAPRVALGGQAFVQDPTKTAEARAERRQRAILDDQQAARRETLAAQQQAAREAQQAAIAAANERAAADRASREGIAREGNQTRQTIAEAIRANRQQANGGTNPKQLAAIQKLGGMYAANPIVKNANTLAEQYEVVKAGAAQQSAQGDMALIFGLMKLYDPGSVVREGEYATAKNAASVPDQIRNAWNKALSGQFLTPEQRQAFVRIAEERVRSQRQLLSPVASHYARLAERQGIDSADVALDPFAGLSEPSAPPARAGGRSVEDVMSKYGLTPRRPR